MKDADHPLYQTYHNMKTRCLNPRNKAYKNYGLRGIGICDRWLSSFRLFVEDMGEKPSPQHSLDRIDNDGDYTPENCRWASKRQQMNNTRENHHLTHDGETRTIAEWSRETGIGQATILDRVNHHGLSHSEALTRPIRAHNEKLADNLAHANAKPVTFNGETHTLGEWARRLGVKTTTLTRRIAKMGVDRALSEPIEPYRPAPGFEMIHHKGAKPIELNGETHTVSGWAAKLGVPYPRLKWRIKTWGVERALSHV